MPAENLTQPCHPNWLCPVCQQRLNWQNSQWRCSQGHSYDRAKEGYVNLLLAQHKNSKDPGDNKDMVLARRAFLQQDHYLPLAREIAGLLRPHLHQLTRHQVINVLDAGCGEGYYLARIKQQLADDALEFNASGVDISKPAIQKAAKQYPDISYAVASSFNLPLPANSQHALIQIFAPGSAGEVERVLTEDGWWISVNPAPGHLFSLKQLVYDNPALHQIDDSVPAGFTLVSQHRLCFDIALNDLTQRRNLLMMTPFYWTISEEKKQHLLSNLLLVSADFSIKVWQKSPQ